MTNTQAANSTGEAARRLHCHAGRLAGRETVFQQTQASQISTTSDALGDSSLDDVSGGLWPQVMTGSSYNKTI
ncbi:hypothetical protein [Bradyrhizobium sp. WSM1743]|uniref:hypothetical protein n=1 Tax=Bradyrhizobium sp. WSM1743 TaxID=318996 RepID=UPI0009FCC74E|nr:hypothetical protein [Bradyrhizobium sp. WSM1743]